MKRAAGATYATVGSLMIILLPLGAVFGAVKRSLMHLARKFIYSVMNVVAMSSKDDVYEAVVTLLKALGGEAARGAIYWGVGAAMQSLLVPAVKKLLMGQSLSPGEIEALRQQLLLQAQAAQQMSPEQMARLVAEQLRPMLAPQAQAQPYPQSQQYYQPPQYQPTAPIQRDDFRRRELEKDLEHYKNLYRELESQYYKELDPQRRMELERRMSELKQRIVEIEARLTAPW